MKKMILVAALFSVSNVFAASMDCKLDIFNPGGKHESLTLTLKQEGDAERGSVVTAGGISAGVFKVDAKNQKTLSMWLGKKIPNDPLNSYLNIGGIERNSLLPKGEEMVLKTSTMDKINGFDMETPIFLTCTGK